MDEQRKRDAEEQAALVGVAMGENMRSISAESDKTIKIKRG